MQEQSTAGKWGQVTGDWPQEKDLKVAEPHPMVLLGCERTEHGQREPGSGPTMQCNYDTKEEPFHGSKSQASCPACQAPSSS